MINDSAVKIPDDVRRNNDDVMETVKWTSKLDRIFRTNQKEDPSLRSGIVMLGVSLIQTDMDRLDHILRV